MLVWLLLVAPIGSAAPAVPAPVELLPDSAPLRAGRVRFEGMVQPTKGGFDVRGVTVDPAALTAAVNVEADSLVGARVRLDAELVSEVSTGPQDRPGDWHRVAALHAVEIVAPAVTVEDTVGNSKGLHSVGAYLVDRAELSAALGGAADLAGRRVRLRGQPRTFVCGPMEQCLVGGSLPMFDVASAVLLP